MSLRLPEYNMPHLLLVVDLSLLTLIVVVLVGRVFSRLKLQGKLSGDDVCILLSAFLVVALVVIHSLMVLNYHLDQPSESIPLVAGRSQALLDGITRTLYPVTSALTRVSVLILTRRLAPYSLIRRTAALLMICNVTFTIIITFLIIFTCIPVKASFSPGGSVHGRCLNFYLIQLSTPITSAVLDIFAWVLPVLLVVRVQFLGWRKKTAVACLLGMGGLACVAGLFRVATLVKGGVDPSSTATSMAIWTTTELAIGIVSASAPALWPLLVSTGVCVRTKLRLQFRSSTPAASAEVELVPQSSRQQQPESSHPMNLLPAANLSREDDIAVSRQIRKCKSHDPLFADNTV
ncbi:hypothetical protein BZA05DRAFT_466495 [Tricharina praecox]|uniref:uncharacterized protein n=1 Tax=Tricharina praecox TaxID=43433 RepID=UPI00221E8C38|nr:uncharacterized protein BZA05DRAFT_466495 [Tricharina praecox]KAI5840892.1 hypothetical protein BZA05DRAFT_466495 [Tricharina praecox]